MAIGLMDAGRQAATPILSRVFDRTDPTTFAPVTRITANTLSDSQRYNAEDNLARTTLVGSGGSSIPVGNLAIFASDDGGRMDITDTVSSGRIDEFAVFITVSGTERLLYLVAYDNRSFYTRGTGEKTISIAWDFSASAITNLTTSVASLDSASNAEVLAGTIRNKYVTPGSFANWVLEKLYQTTPDTVTDRNLDNYITPGIYLLTPSGGSWSSAPSGLGTGTILLRVWQYGVDNKRIAQELIGTPSSSSASDPLVFQRYTQPHSATRTWRNWQTSGQLDYANVNEINAGTPSKPVDTVQLRNSRVPLVHIGAWDLTNRKPGDIRAY